jgi:amidophosphoribosyltransferase
MRVYWRISVDKFREECAVVGVWNVPEAANMAYLGLYAQQHRGQEGAGVVSLDGPDASFNIHKGLGLVAEVFGGFDFANLRGDTAVGHVRYTTAGTSSLSNVQPFCAQTGTGRVALVHNGNLTNADELREELIEKGSIFSSTSDSEIFLHLMARGTKSNNPAENLIGALLRAKGAFSLVVMMQDRMFAVRDPQGFRPLAMGRFGDGVVFASETCAFDLIGVEYERDVEPGEVLEIGSDGSVRSYFPFGTSQKLSPCIFEYVYFSRPDSLVFGRNVYEIRKKMGAELAKESPVENAAMVVPVPDSGITSALGYAQTATVPLELGLIRNHYVGRTFIEPKQSIRDFGVKLKLNANPELLKGKVIVVIDDSIVRGTTSRKLLKMLRSAGASEVHMRISAPPTTNPCYYGIDTPDKEELIASHMDVEQIREYLGADSLAYLSMEGLYRAVGDARGTFCDACFSGDYPVQIFTGKARQPELFSKP